MSTMTASSALSLEHIHKSYGSKVVLSDASVSFEAGTITALVGPNGAGKTTLLRIAAALQFPDSGTVTGQRVGYFGGFETMPVKGTVDGLFSALGLDVAKGDRRRLSSLSRGELQWIGVDAVFALGCRSVLLDEPWTGLEPDRREDLSRRIADEAARGTAVVCASHDLDEVDRVAQRIYFIGKGKVVEVHERNDAGRELLLQMFREAKPAR